MYPGAKKGEEAVVKPVKDKLTYGMFPTEEMVVICSLSAHVIFNVVQG